LFKSKKEIPEGEGEKTFSNLKKKGLKRFSNLLLLISVRYDMNIPQF